MSRIRIIRRSSNPFLRLFYEDTATRRILPPPRHCSACHGGAYKSHEVSDPSRHSQTRHYTRATAVACTPSLETHGRQHMPDTTTGVVGDHATFVSPAMAGVATPWWGQSTHTLGFFVDEPHPHHPGALRTTLSEPQASPPSEPLASLPSEPRSGRGSVNRGSEHSEDPG